MTHDDCANLAVRLGLWPLEPSDSVVHCNLLQEGVALGLREVGSLHLAKVELYGAVVADDVREKGLAVQAVLADLECDSWLSAVLGEGQHQFIALKVLKKEKSCCLFVHWNLERH